MSDRTQQLAAQIAELLQKSETDDSAHLRQSLEKINERLDRIETRIESQNPKSQIPNPKSTHPSQEKFAVAEAIADSLIEKPGEEKACRFEPTGKPCDHCSMCSARGF